MKDPNKYFIYDWAFDCRHKLSELSFVKGDCPNYDKIEGKDIFEAAKILVEEGINAMIYNVKTKEQDYPYDYILYVDTKKFGQR
jgi:hypothetical protein